MAEGFFSPLQHNYHMPSPQLKPSPSEIAPVQPEFEKRSVTYYAEEKKTPPKPRVVILEKPKSNPEEKENPAYSRTLLFDKSTNKYYDETLDGPYNKDRGTEGWRTFEEWKKAFSEAQSPMVVPQAFRFDEPQPLVRENFIVTVPKKELEKTAVKPAVRTSLFSDANRKMLKMVGENSNLEFVVGTYASPSGRKYHRLLIYNKDTKKYFDYRMGARWRDENSWEKSLGLRGYSYSFSKFEDVEGLERILGVARRSTPPVDKTVQKTAKTTPQPEQKNIIIVNKETNPVQEKTTQNANASQNNIVENKEPIVKSPRAKKGRFTVEEDTDAYAPPAAINTAPVPKQEDKGNNAALSSISPKLANEMNVLTAIGLSEKNSPLRTAVDYPDIFLSSIKPYAASIVKYCKMYEVPPEAVIGIIWSESVKPSGAEKEYKLGNFNPKMAAWLKNKHKIDVTQGTDQHIQGIVLYLSLCLNGTPEIPGMGMPGAFGAYSVGRKSFQALLNQYGSVEGILSAYNNYNAAMNNYEIEFKKYNKDRVNYEKIHHTLSGFVGVVPIPTKPTLPVPISDQAANHIATCSFIAALVSQPNFLEKLSEMPLNDFKNTEDYKNMVILASNTAVR